ncbi:helix-turn-helix domain-containing protein [Variovorax sp.]|uniref:helix-turn-helix domain-containing protein n=1 Tax=Variovorax sp. TaxID=1871043 RepID=UPI003BAAEA53
MSNEVTALCRPVRLTPAQKAVLMCLADRCDDSGLAWPSVPGISEWTCLQRTAVIEALKALDGLGLVSIERSRGRNNRCRIAVDKLKTYPQKSDNHSAKRTRPANGLVRETDHTRPGNGLVPVRQTDYTRPANGPKASISTMKASEKHQASRKRDPAPCPEDVPQALMADYLKVRVAKKAGPLTATALAGLRREASKAGISLEAAITACCEFGWQGFNADWYAQRRPLEAASTMAAHDPDSQSAVEAEGERLGLGRWSQTEQWAAYKARVRQAQRPGLGGSA